MLLLRIFAVIYLLGVAVCLAITLETFKKWIKEELFRHRRPFLSIMAELIFCIVHSIFWPFNLDCIIQDYKKQTRR